MMHLYWHVIHNMRYKKGKVMNFVTGYHDVVGTSYQGKIEASYDTLCEVFGEPEVLDDDKVQVQWAIKFSDGTLATIYDWKDANRTSEILKWHIGGHSEAAVYNVVDEVI
jgi:hypothetical protein